MELLDNINSPLQWSCALSVDNQILDNQHKKILGLCADMERQLAAGVVDFSIPLIQMTEYANAHFKTEIALLEGLRLFDLEAHKACQKEFHDRLSRFKVKNLTGSLNPRELIEFLQDWWMNHIVVKDMQFKPHFTRTNQAGAAP